VGVITAVEQNRLTIVEGNHGGTVGRRTIPVNARYVRGFIRACWGEAPAEGEPETEPENGRENETVHEPANGVLLPALSRGMHGEAVRAMQALLNLRCKTRLRTDASFGPKTEQAVKCARTKASLPAAPVCDAALWQYLLNGASE